MNLHKNPDHGKDFLTAREIADRSGIGVNAVYHLIKNGTIPSISLGRTFLVPRPQYEHWLATVKGELASPPMWDQNADTKPDPRAANAHKAREAWKRIRAERREQRKNASNGVANE